MSIAPPRTYAEWLPLLDRFAEGDDSVLHALQQGAIEWTNVVAERWTSRVAATLTVRLQALNRQLQLGLKRSGGDVFAVSRALLDTRRTLGPLHALAALPCAPENVRNHLAGEITRFVEQTQAGLEKSASETRTDNGRLLKTIRDNSLLLPAAPVRPLAEAVGPAPESAVPRGRRIIL